MKMVYFYLFLAIATEVVGTSALKQSEGFSKLMPSLLVLVSYAASFYFLALVLKTLPVGITYAIWAGVGIILVALVGVFYFKQTLDFAAVMGMFLIILGVMVIHLFSTSIEH